MPFGIDISNYIDEVTIFLEDVDFPVDKNQMIEQVRDSGAPDYVVSGLEKLPDGIYERMSDVTDLLAEEQGAR